MTVQEARKALVARGHHHDDATAIVDALAAHALSQAQFNAAIAALVNN